MFTHPDHYCYYYHTSVILVDRSLPLQMIFPTWKHTSWHLLQSIISMKLYSRDRWCWQALPFSRLVAFCFFFTWWFIFIFFFFYIHDSYIFTWLSSFIFLTSSHYTTIFCMIYRFSTLEISFSYWHDYICYPNSTLHLSV